MAPLLLALGCLWHGLPGSARRELAVLTEPSTAVAGTVMRHRAEVRSVSTPTLLTRRIDEIRPGMRVLAEHPDATENAKPDVDIYPPHWRLVSLKMPHPEGGVVEIDTLRPAAWLRECDAGVGGVVPLAVAELREAGLALVIDIQPCPVIQRGTGRIVTSTFRHTADSLVDLRLASDEQIGTTSNHPFWSEDRHDFVAAKSLVRGERLRNANGTVATVASLAARGERLTVYNLEVDAEHVYHVGAGGVLVHNDCHHPIPRFLGGFDDQIFSRIPAPIHREFHQLLRDNLRGAGINMNIGGRGGSRLDWEDFLRTNPGSQRAAFDAVLDASRAIDVRHGTKITQDVWANIMSGNFSAWP